MREIVLFGEDYGHEAVLVPLIKRLADEQGADIRVTALSCRHGHGRAVGELADFLRDVATGLAGLPDLIVVAIDANCNGLNAQAAEIAARVPAGLRDMVVCAVPDPHIERWLLLDSQAFKTVLGRGCRAPSMKCERDRYKRLLREAVSEAGVTPLLGGLEYAEDIVEALDLARARRADQAFDRTVTSVEAVLRRWASGTPGGREN